MSGFSFFIQIYLPLLSKDINLKDKDMHILEDVKSTLKHRQDELFNLAKKAEMLSTLTRTLLGTLETLLSSGDVTAYSYGKRKQMIAETDELIAGINASLMVEEREE